jgi:hypothetical protein
LESNRPREFVPRGIVSSRRISGSVPSPVLAGETLGMRAAGDEQRPLPGKARGRVAGNRWKYARRTRPVLSQPLPRTDVSYEFSKHRSVGRLFKIASHQA